MKNQLHIIIYNFWVIAYVLLILFFDCKNNPKDSFLLNNDAKSNSFYEIRFLQKTPKELEELPFETILLPKEYNQIGIPTNQRPYFSSDGCFYYLDPFYYYNEFGLVVKYCHREILENFDQLNYLINHIDSELKIPLSTNTIKVQKTTINQLGKENYVLIYNTFLESSISEKLKNLKTSYYFYSQKFFKKQDTFLPKRFYETEYAILIKNQEINFLYKIENKLVIITIKDINFLNDLLNLFYKLNINFTITFKTSKDIYLDMILFNKKQLEKIRLASLENFVVLYNPKNQSYSFLFPYSYVIFDLNEIEHSISKSDLTIYFQDSYNFKINHQGIISENWMFYDGFYKPNEICLWKECSIKDLDRNIFTLKTETNCTLEDFVLTEINPWGIVENNQTSSYGKFIEIKSNQNCDNNTNQIYLSINDILISLPKEIKDIVYLFSASNQYYFYENQIVNFNISSFKINQSIKLKRFFPFEERLLFSGIEDQNSSFIYGDSKNKIFKKIHSIKVLSKDDWEFHSSFCKGTQNCEDYAFSPGYEDTPKQDNYECSISELLIGGPFDSNNKRIPEDEFIEIDCQSKQNINKNFINIIYKNNYKYYYFPSPEIPRRFLLLHDKPKCIQPENYIVVSTLTIPNSMSEYRTSNQKIRIGKYELKHFIHTDFPKSLNYIKNYDLLLPTDTSENFHNCRGYATPEKNNKPIPYLYINDYSGQTITSIFEQPYQVKIYNENNTLIEERIISPNQTFGINTNFSYPYQRRILKFVIDNSVEQYLEIFNEKPLCFIDSLYIDSPESLRICFLEDGDYKLYLKDNSTEIRILPYKNKFLNPIIETNYLDNLEKNYYKIKKHECIVLIEPTSTIREFYLKPPKEPFIDVYLTTANKNKIGNGLSNNEYIEIYTYIDNQKISLCSYGFPEFKLAPFKIKNQELILHHHYFKDNSFYFGLNYFDGEIQ